MAVKKADEYQHNNANDAFVDSNFVRGGARVVANRTELYALVVKADQLKQDVTVVRVKSDGENNGAATDLLLIDDDSIGSAAGWQVKTSGTGAGGPSGTLGSYLERSFIWTEADPTTDLPEGSARLDYLMDATGVNIIPPNRTLNFSATPPTLTVTGGALDGETLYYRVQLGTTTPPVDPGEDAYVMGAPYSFNEPYTV